MPSEYLRSSLQCARVGGIVFLNRAFVDEVLVWNHLCAREYLDRPEVGRDMSLRISSHQEFGRHRLADYLPRESIVDVNSWEYLEHLWCGETSGFTQWLRLESDPELLRSVAVDLNALPGVVSATMLDALGLPLRVGMDLDTISAVLGKPHASVNFTSDRTTFEFHVGDLDMYEVGCTVNHAHGLTYVTMHAIPLPDVV